MVSRDPVTDPFFHQSVVLMLPPIPQNPLVVGLILNRPTRVPLSQVFPEDKTFKDRSDVAFFGGPVDPQSPGIVFRSNQPPKEAIQAFGNIYVSFNRVFIEGFLKKSEAGQQWRLFLGRAQWAPAQLQGEVLGGAWNDVRAEGNLIFAADQTYLWRTLSERAEPAPVAELKLPSQESR